jgi:hypothetical protein
VSSDEFSLDEPAASERRTTARTRQELGHAPIARAVTVRGKELARDSTVADARRLFASRSVQVIPVLDGTTYLGTISRDTIRPGMSPDLAVAPLVSDEVPVARAGTAADVALELLDRTGGRRLVVVADTSDDYVGLVCLGRDRAHLCVDADCDHTVDARAQASWSPRTSAVRQQQV